MISFKALRQYLAEHGNPLARLKTHIDNDRAFVGLSAERSDLTKEQNADRVKDLASRIGKQGYGFKHARGLWQGGSEHSLIIHAKEPGDEGARQLYHDMKAHSEHFGQDAVFHHQGKSGKLIGTNDTGWPGRNKVTDQGRVAFNRTKKDDGSDVEFQTELRPSKSSARFTTLKAKSKLP